jgi:ubiquinone biosynthesis protein UbiJ
VYEQPVVVDTTQFEGFVADIKTLRDATERLEKRVSKLQKFAQDSGSQTTPPGTDKT